MATRKSGVRSLAVSAILVLAFAMCKTSDAQDLSSMPWVNESGEVVPYGLNERGDAATKDRANIRDAPTTTYTPPSRMNTNIDWGGVTRPLIIALYAIGILLIIAVMVWLFFAARSDGNTDSVGHMGSRRSLEESIKQLPFELDTQLGDFRQQAWDAYQAGDLRKSLIYLFSHVLVTLDQRGLVYLRKGKTNRQYLRELRRYPQLADYYGDVMVPFEQTFFGDHPVDREICEQCWNDLDQFQSNVDTVGKAGQQ